MIYSQAGVAPRVEQEGVAEARGGVGVIRTQYALPDVQGALEQGPGCGQLALGVEEAGQSTEGQGGFWVVGSEDPLPDVQDALQEGAGCIQLARVPKQDTEAMDTENGISVV